MCAGVVKVGPKKSVGTTNNMGRSEREKGDKLGGPSGSVTGILGCQTGKWGAQNVCPNLGPIAGQSLNCNGVQNVWPSYSYSEVNDWDDEKVKETGKGKEKTEGVELFCLGSRQRREDMADVAKALQENNPTHKGGQKELNNSERGTSREEFGNPKEAIGNHNTEKGRSFRDLDRESFSGKFSNHKTSISVGGVGDGGVGINTGEKEERSLIAVDGLCNLQAEAGLKTSSCPHGISGVKAKKTGFEVEDDFDTRVVRKAWTGTNLLGQQEGPRMAALCSLQNQHLNHESVRDDGIVCGSGSIDALDTVSGRILCRALGVVHLMSGQLGPSPSQFRGPIMDGPNQLDHKGFEEKVEGEVYGLNQDSVLRLPSPPEYRASISSESYIAEEGNKKFSKEDGVITVDQPQEDDREQTKRYADKLYDQSPSSGFSVFRRPLLLGGCSGVGGTYGIKDLETVRNEGVDDGVRGKVVAERVLQMERMSRKRKGARREDKMSPQGTRDTTAGKVGAWQNSVKF